MASNKNLFPVLMVCEEFDCPLHEEINLLIPPLNSGIISYSEIKIVYA